MFGKLTFFAAIVLFLVSLFTPSVSITDDRSLVGAETFFYTLRYGTAGLFSAKSVADTVINFIALVAAAANFVFVFWAMLVFAPTRIPALRWFWWVSLLFLLAALFTGFQVAIDARTTLDAGYFFWVASLILMLLAPVIRRIERRRERQAQIAV